ncbi:MAG: class I SAM-dependent methyltransferase [Ferruginibacter sp.]
MYSSLQLTIKYLKYYFSASNGKGHGIHSPFVFEFIKHVLNDTRHYAIYDSAEGMRKQLLKEEAYIEVEDFGAGSVLLKNRRRKIKDIAASSLKPKKYSRLLFRMVQYYKAAHVLELGTSLGITTAYLASADNEPEVTTMEGSENIAAIAQQNFAGLDLENIKIITGDFEQVLAPYLQTASVDLAFLDGNHRKQPTLQYFEQLLKRSHNDTIIVLDDIHWSREMEEAWEAVKGHSAVTLSIDLFFIGIVFLRKEFKVKQHFTVRF